jgi:hypothetical protein
MCQATVYLAQEGQEKEIMRDAVLLELDEEGLRLHSCACRPSSRNRLWSKRRSAALTF